MVVVLVLVLEGRSLVGDADGLEYGWTGGIGG